MIIELVGGPFDGHIEDTEEINPHTGDIRNFLDKKFGQPSKWIQYTFREGKYRYETLAPTKPMDMPAD